MKKEYIGLAIVAGLMLAIILSMVIYNQWPLMTGERIVLATEPVDPMDPFKGQYMQINYEISTQEASGLTQGNTAYVILEEDEQGIWRGTRVSQSEPEQGTFIRGRVAYIYDSTANLDFGIEQYFFEMGADFPTQNITVEAKVSSSGRAKIVQLLQDGKPVKIEYKKLDIKA